MTMSQSRKGLHAEEGDGERGSIRLILSCIIVFVAASARHGLGYIVDITYSNSLDCSWPLQKGESSNSVVRECT